MKKAAAIQFSDGSICSCISWWIDAGQTAGLKKTGTDRLFKK